MSVKRKYNKANIHISGKFVPSNKGKFIVDAEYVRDDRTDESLLESLNQIDESNQDTNRRIDDMFDSGKIKSDLLPSYVDDIIEGYYYNGAFYLDSEHTQEIQGESGKIYSDISVTPAVDYRWGGSAYVVHHAQADWGQSDATAPDYIKNKPTIPDEQIQSDWEQSDNTQKNFIKNKPTIPAAPVQSDWNQSDNTKLDYIKNKPYETFIRELEYISNEGGVVLFQFGNIPSINSKKVVVYVGDYKSYASNISIRVNGTDIPIVYSNNPSENVKVKDISNNFVLLTLSYNSNSQSCKFEKMINPYAKAKDITATNLATAITNSTLVQYQLYYDTTNSKLLMATSANTLVEITTTPYTPSV